jgi:FkbM family methyltransferase
MKKIATNILKSILRVYPQQEISNNSKGISWYNEKVLKHQDDTKDKILSTFGFKIIYKKPYELLHTHEDIFFKEIYRFKSETNTPLIIDCGANIGLAVLYFKKIFPGAKIFAFEPDDLNFQLLEKNITTNKLTGVIAKKAAVWNSNGFISFKSEASEGSHIAFDGSGNELVSTVRLADLLTFEDKIDFLKIDIEGAEWTVLQDCKQALTNVQNLFLEYHGRTDETEKLVGIYTILSNAGFSVYTQNASTNLNQPFIEKNSKSKYDVQLNIFCFRK